MATNDKLSIKQQLFIKHISEGETQRIAYKLAGYNCSSMELVDSSASRLLSSAKVSKALSVLRDKIAKKSEWNATKIIKEFAELYNSSKSIDKPTACRSLENIAKLIGAYQQPDQGNLLITQYLQHVTNIYGTTEAK